MSACNLQLFDDLIEKLKNRFPHLEFTRIDDAPVERAYEIKKQGNLVTGVCLNLQNGDELHLNIGDHFWVEWFPCHRTGICEDFYDIAEGFLAGRHRVVETYRSGRCCKSVLQRNEDGAWRQIARSIHVGGWSWPWSEERIEIIQSGIPPDS